MLFACSGAMHIRTVQAGYTRSLDVGPLMKQSHAIEQRLLIEKYVLLVNFARVYIGIGVVVVLSLIRMLTIFSRSCEPRLAIRYNPCLLIIHSWPITTVEQA